MRSIRFGIQKQVVDLTNSGRRIRTYSHAEKYTDRYLCFCMGVGIWLPVIWYILVASSSEA
ncbi:hypothetical protein O9993_12360 [Vibrio lentus]|nr:hypothetical protein [Vibrio lentus]